MANPHASFMIHRTTSPPVGTTSDRLHAVIKSVIIDYARIEAIFKDAKLKITSEQQDIHRVADLWLSAEEAISASLATDIGEFAPPKGTQLFFVGAA